MASEQEDFSDSSWETISTEDLSFDNLTQDLKKSSSWETISTEDLSLDNLTQDLKKSSSWETISSEDLSFDDLTQDLKSSSWETISTDDLPSETQTEHLKKEDLPSETQTEHLEKEDLPSETQTEHLKKEDLPSETQTEDLKKVQNDQEKSLVSNEVPTTTFSEDVVEPMDSTKRIFDITLAQTDLETLLSDPILSGSEDLPECIDYMIEQIANEINEHNNTQQILSECNEHQLSEDHKNEEKNASKDQNQEQQSPPMQQNEQMRNKMQQHQQYNRNYFFYQRNRYQNRQPPQQRLTRQERRTAYYTRYQQQRQQQQQFNHQYQGLPINHLIYRNILRHNPRPQQHCYGQRQFRAQTYHFVRWCNPNGRGTLFNTCTTISPIYNYIMPLSRGQQSNQDSQYQQRDQLNLNEVLQRPQQGLPQYPQWRQQQIHQQGQQQLHQQGQQQLHQQGQQQFYQKQPQICNQQETQVPIQERHTPQQQFYQSESQLSTEQYWAQRMQQQEQQPHNEPQQPIFNQHAPTQALIQKQQLQQQQFYLNESQLSTEQYWAQRMQQQERQPHYEPQYWAQRMQQQERQPHYEPQYWAQRMQQQERQPHYEPQYWAQRMQQQERQSHYEPQYWAQRMQQQERQPHYEPQYWAQRMQQQEQQPHNEPQYWAQRMQQQERQPHYEPQTPIFNQHAPTQALIQEQQLQQQQFYLNESQLSTEQYWAQRMQQQERQPHYEPQPSISNQHLTQAPIQEQQLQQQQFYLNESQLSTEQYWAQRMQQQEQQPHHEPQPSISNQHLTQAPIQEQQLQQQQFYLNESQLSTEQYWAQRMQQQEQQLHHEPQPSISNQHLTQAPIQGQHLPQQQQARNLQQNQFLQQKQQLEEEKLLQEQAKSLQRQRALQHEIFKQHLQKQQQKEQMLQNNYNAKQEELRQQQLLAEHFEKLRKQQQEQFKAKFKKQVEHLQRRKLLLQMEYERVKDNLRRELISTKQNETLRQQAQCAENEVFQRQRWTYELLQLQQQKQMLHEQQSQQNMQTFEELQEKYRSNENLFQQLKQRLAQEEIELRQQLRQHYLEQQNQNYSTNFQPPERNSNQQQNPRNDPSTVSLQELSLTTDEQRNRIDLHRRVNPELRTSLLTAEVMAGINDANKNTHEESPSKASTSQQRPTQSSAQPALQQTFKIHEFCLPSDWQQKINQTDIQKLQHQDNPVLTHIGEEKRRDVHETTRAGYLDVSNYEDPNFSYLSRNLNEEQHLDDSVAATINSSIQSIDLKCFGLSNTNDQPNSTVANQTIPSDCKKEASTSLRGPQQATSDIPQNQKTAKLHHHHTNYEAFLLKYDIDRSQRLYQRNDHVQYNRHSQQPQKVNTPMSSHDRLSKSSNDGQYETQQISEKSANVRKRIKESLPHGLIPHQSDDDDEEADVETSAQKETRKNAENAHEKPTNLGLTNSHDTEYYLYNNDLIASEHLFMDNRHSEPGLRCYHEINESKLNKNLLRQQPMPYKFMRSRPQLANGIGAAASTVIGACPEGLNNPAFLKINGNKFPSNICEIFNKEKMVKLLKHISKMDLYTISDEGLLYFFHTADSEFIKWKVKNELIKRGWNYITVQQEWFTASTRNDYVYNQYGCTGRFLIYNKKTFLGTSSWFSASITGVEIIPNDLSMYADAFFENTSEEEISEHELPSTQSEKENTAFYQHLTAAVSSKSSAPSDTHRENVLTAQEKHRQVLAEFNNTSMKYTANELKILCKKFVESRENLRNSISNAIPEGAPSQQVLTNAKLQIDILYAVIDRYNTDAKNTLQHAYDILNLLDEFERRCVTEILNRIYMLDNADFIIDPFRTNKINETSFTFTFGVNFILSHYLIAAAQQAFYHNRYNEYLQHVDDLAARINHNICLRLVRDDRKTVSNINPVSIQSMSHMRSAPTSADSNIPKNEESPQSQPPTSSLTGQFLHDIKDDTVHATSSPLSVAQNVSAEIRHEPKINILHANTATKSESLQPQMTVGENFPELEEEQLEELPQNIHLFVQTDNTQEELQAPVPKLSETSWNNWHAMLSTLRKTPFPKRKYPAAATLSSQSQQSQAALNLQAQPAWSKKQ